MNLHSQVKRLEKEASKIDNFSMHSTEEWTGEELRSLIRCKNEGLRLPKDLKRKYDDMEKTKSYKRFYEAFSQLTEEELRKAAALGDIEE